MKERVFLDTHVLVYADDADAGEKRRVALDLVEEALRQGTGVVSTQVLQEYFVVSTRKCAVPADVARRKVELLGRLDVVPIRLDDILAAIDLLRLHGITFWDGLILRAASVGGCRVVLSEDLQHDRAYDSVRVVDPFR